MEGPRPREIDWAAVRERLAPRAQDPRRAERVLAERARALAAPPPRELAREALATLAVDAGGERYALPLTAVLRVELTGAVARIPGAPPGVAGVANLQGTALPLLDLPALLALPGATAERRRWSVVLGRRGPELAIAADALELVDVPRERLAPAGPRLGVTCDGRVVLDAEAILRPAAAAAPGGR